MAKTTTHQGKEISYYDKLNSSYFLVHSIIWYCISLIKF
jgi:hypothetical protein